MSSTTASPALSRAGRAYVAAVVLGGSALFAHSLYSLRGQDPTTWLIFALLTFTAGRLTIPIPSVPARISVSEAFLIASVLTCGPAAGTVTVAVDAAIFSIQKRFGLRRGLFNCATLVVSLWTAGRVYFLAGGVNPAAHPEQFSALPHLAVPLALLAIVYFVANSALIAFAVAFETGAQPFRIWREHFLWLSLNYAAGASVALLLVLSMRQFSFSVIAVVLPLLAISYLTVRSSLGRIEDAHQHIARVDRLYLSTIETLATAIDAKDEVTHGHIRRVQSLTLQLARELGIDDQPTLKAIEAAALLHDTGKLAVPEHILNKPGKLTPAEFERMKLHAPIGAEILSNVDFPYPVVPIVRHHHENWDGTGYPDGLKATEIPIGARILSVVDCFDALTSDRPYRRRLSSEAAIAILLERRGTMYDPEVVDTFIAVQHRCADAVAATQDSVDRAAPIRLPDWSSPPPSPAHADGSDESNLELSSFRALAAVLPRETRVDDIVVLLAACLRAVCPVRIAAVYAVDPHRDEVVLQYAWGRGGERLVGHRLALGAGLTGWVAVNRQPIVNSEAALDLGEQTSVTTAPLTCCLSVPLMAGDIVIGVLSLYASAPEAYTAQHGRTIQLAAPHIASVMERHLSATSAPKPPVWTNTSAAPRTTVH